MRSTVLRVALAVTTMVALAFLIPLGLVVREIARDRAFSDAERQAAALQPALAITTDPVALEPALAKATAGSEGRMAIYLPGTAVIGHPHADPRDLQRARDRTQAFRVPTSGGWVLLQPVALNGQVTVVEVYVPGGELSRGVGKAWLVLTGVAVALVGGSLVVADRLGARVVRSAKSLSGAAQTLGGGDLTVRLTPEGPTELRDAAHAFNSMADRVEQLMAAERELAADLSHRLRTPLTALRLNAASLGDGQVAEQTRHAVAQLEREVDRIIRTARRQTEAVAEPAGSDLAEVVRERMAFWSALADDEERDWRLDGAEAADGPVRVPVPRAELAAAIDAMLGNIFRHTPEGSPFAVTLHVGGPDTVILLVADGGSGIADPESALRRGHGHGGDGSTGLGLDIVRRVAETSGGAVRLERSVLGGAQIAVRFGAGARPPAARTGRRGRRARAKSGR
ncbi:HAMP domain-containing sensor histidine kinase [Uniformispora flossi]|uniref:HAMP domain-containing sensor histidine kinase n=1 Tax=Uniformispora flossi TaxID=3390723 RepID=UPI003C2D855E